MILFDDAHSLKMFDFAFYIGSAPTFYISICASIDRSKSYTAMPYLPWQNSNSVTRIFAANILKYFVSVKSDNYFRAEEIECRWNNIYILPPELE